MFSRDQPPGSGGAANMGQDMVRPLVIAAPLIALIVLSGCARGMAGSSRRICYDQGLRPGTPEFSNCWHSERDRQFRADAAGIAIGLGVVAAQNQPPRDNRLIDNRPEQWICTYWTPQGERRMLPINGLCPLRYGQ